MTHTERSPKAPALTTGIFATLRVLLPAKGCGAPSTLGLRRGAISLAALCTFLCALALSATPASAAFIYPSLGEISGPAPGEHFGQLLSESVAVNDHNGHVYVADSGTGLVYDFTSASDTSPTVWDGAATPASSFGEGKLAVAADNSSGDVYVADLTHAVIDKFDSDGNLIESFGDTTPTPNGQLAGAATPDGSFSPPSTSSIIGTFGIAVDQATHDLYAVDSGHEVIDVFSESGEYLPAKQITATPAGLYGCGGDFADGIAVNATSGHVFVSDSCQVLAFEFDSSGAYLKTLTGSNTPAGTFGGGFLSVAVDDAGGLLYVSVTHGAAEGLTDVFDSSGEYLTQLGHSFNGPRGVAVDQATGRVYVSDNKTGTSGPGVIDIFDRLVIPDVTTEPPTEVRPREATLDLEATLGGTVNPDGAGDATCRFLWGTSEAFGEEAPCEAGVPNGSSSVPVHMTLELQPDTTYFYRLQATNHNGTNPGLATQTQHFTTPGPGLRSESVSSVAATSATLQATIDPHGAPTSYYFQYGIDTSYGASVPAPPGASIGAGEGDIEVAQHTQDLAARTTYHYRVLALSELKAGEITAFAGPDQTFTTQTPGPFALPDQRAWELVSPPDKHGAQLQSNFQGEVAFQAAAAGDAVTYLASSPTEADPQGFSSEVQLLSTRGPAGWATLDIDTPHSQHTGAAVGIGMPYKLFSTDLSLGVVQPFGAFEPSLSPEASEQTPYLRTNFAPGEPSAICTTSCYRPLVTAAEGFADVPPGTEFGEEGQCPSFGHRVFCGPEFRAASPDLRHIVLISQASLLPGAPPRSLYEYSVEAPPAERLQLVSGGDIGTPGSAHGSRRAGAISADGSRVFLAGTMFDLPAEEALKLDAADPGCATCVSGGGNFKLASSDGSKAFFTAGKLTADSGAKAAKPDLYRCEILADSEGKPECRLSDLTPESGGESADVQGVIAASEDGAYLYFVANGALAPGATPGTCVHNVVDQDTSPPGATCNLYVSHDGTISLVAVLSGQDSPDWASQEVANMSARVSPDGRWLAFMSERPLTGYDNRDVLTGARDEEVFLYSAEAEKLICASCNPTGARPLGTKFEGEGKPGQGGPGIESGLIETFLGGNRAWTGTGSSLAALVPGWTTPNYQPRYLSDSGRLFFNSLSALAPTDSNGTWDVYQYEPPGAGGCTESSLAFAPRSAGCLGLISSGASPQPSAFIDASASGDDVFFYTSAQLSPRDADTSLDLYDARTGGGEAEPVKPVDCSGDACQPPAVPPNDPTPSSLTFQGAGNEVQCPKGKVKKGGKCVATKKHKAKKHGKGKSHKKGKKSAAKRGGGAR